MSHVARSLTRFYEICLVAYPQDFRRRYGPEMVQVFRTAMVEPPGSPVTVFAVSMADLAGSALRERLATVRWDTHYLLVSMVAILLSVASGYLHLRTDADEMAAGLVLAGALLCGALYPSRPLRWGVIVGTGVPLALVVGHRLAGTHLGSHDADALSPLTLVPGLFGAYVGSVLAALLRRPAFGQA